MAGASLGHTDKGIAVRAAALISSHPVAFIFLLALIVRVFIAVLLTKYFSGTLVLDDTTYHQMAEQMAAGTTSFWDDFTFQLYWSTGAFTVPITFLYRIFGASPIVGQLFVALMGSLTAVFVTRLVLEFLAPRWALFAGAIVALLPSQAFWSSMLMKDASVWFVLAGLGATVAVASRATGKRLAMLGVAAGGFLFLLSYLRLHTLVVAAWALMIAAFFGAKDDRIARIIGALVLGITIPLVFGAIGPAGLSLITDHGSLEERRFLNAQGANTAIVPIPVESEADDIAIRDLEAQATQLESQAAELEEVDPTAAEKLRRRAVDLRTKTEAAVSPQPDVEAETPLNPSLVHLPRGLSAMLLEPFPLPFEGSISLKLARLESLLWYPLLLLAAAGLWKVRPYFREMVFPLLVGGGIVVMYALSEGNIGTAHRHRGEFVWVVALLASIGLSRFGESGRTSVGEDE